MTSAPSPEARPLDGFRIGVTAARKADEQVALLRRAAEIAELAREIETELQRARQAADAGA